MMYSIEEYEKKKKSIDIKIKKIKSACGTISVLLKANKTALNADI